MDAVAEWILTERDLDFFGRLAPDVAQSYLARIGTAQWLRLIGLFGDERAAGIFSGVLQGAGAPVLERLLAVLNALLRSEAAPELVRTQLVALPQYLSSVLSTPKDQLSAEGLRSLLHVASGQTQPPTWAYELAHLVTRDANRQYVHHILVPVLRSDGRDSTLGAALAAWAREFVAGLVTIRPQPPADWRREAPKEFSYEKAWVPLQAFMESPTEQVFDFRAVQQSRTALEEVINRLPIDLHTETIRRGSPHILRLTKTQRTYDQDLKRWEEDRLLLAGIPV
jgi:hypothetical protein